MMSDTCGLTFYAPLGKWDRDSSCWKTSEATSLWALTLSSLTLPTWGGLHDGELYELPTPQHLTNAPASSSLPTPTKGDGEGGGKRVGVTWEDTTKSTAQGGASRLRDVAGLLATLPTPTASDTNGAGAHGTGGADLRTAVTLLPTPTTQDKVGVRGDFNYDSANQTLREVASLLGQPGVITAPPSPDGSASSDDPHPHLLSLDGLAHPA
jgi:hypothetical protein